MVQNHTTQSHVPRRNNHNHQNNKMHLMRKMPRILEQAHIWKCAKYQPLWQKIVKLKLTNETTIAKESGKTHDYTQEWVYLGIRRDGKALNRGPTLMLMRHTKLHFNSTHQSIKRQNTAENLIRKNMLDPERIDHRTACNTTQDRVTHRLHSLNSCFRPHV